MAALPVEILRRIFKELAGTWSADICIPERVPDASSVRAWLRCTLVCKYWRRVGLGDPLLWAMVLPNGNDCQGEVVSLSQRLARSGSAPLQVVIHDVDVTDWAVLHKLSSFHTRFESFRVRTEGTLEKLTIFDSNAPNLTTLHIGRITTFYDDELPTLFGGHTNSVRHLSLHNVEQLGNNTFRRLSYIHLSHQHYTAHVPSPAGTNIRDLVSMLRCNPGLKTCIFTSCDVLKPGEIGYPSAKELCSLSQLHRVVFARCSDFFTTITLGRLQLTDHSKLALSIDHRGDMLVFDPAVTVSVSPLLIAPACKITFACPNQHMTDRRDAYAFATILAVQPSSAFQITLRQDPTVLDCGLVRVMRRHLSSAPYNILEELWLSGTEHSPEDEWRLFFSELQSLTTLTIDFGGTAPQHAAKWLGALRPHAASMPAPALHTLVCVALPIRMGLMLATLHSTVRARQANDHHLTLLHVQREEEKGHDSYVNLAVKDWWEGVKNRPHSWVDEIRDEMVEVVPEFGLPEMFRGYPEFTDRFLST